MDDLESGVSLYLNTTNTLRNDAPLKLDNIIRLPSGPDGTPGFKLKR